MTRRRAPAPDNASAGEAASEARPLLSDREEARTRALAKRQPEAIPPRIRLAVQCWRKGDLTEALDWADGALALDPRNITAYRVRANVLADMRQTVRAVETAMQALAAAPRSLAAHALAVRMLLEDLQPGKAQELLDAALDLDPGPVELRQLKVLQKQILSVTRQAERNPLNWIARKFNRRRANVAGEDPDAA